MNNQTVSNQTIELLQNHRVYREFDSSATVPDSQLKRHHQMRPASTQLAKRTALQHYQY